MLELAGTVVCAGLLIAPAIRADAGLLQDRRLAEPAPPRRAIGPVSATDSSDLPHCVQSSRSIEGDWTIQTGQMGMNTPVYGDFDPLVAGQEVVVSVFCASLYPVTVWTDIYAMHADGSFMDGWGPRRISGGAPSDGPAMGDLDDDGKLELVLAIGEYSSSGHSYVTVLESDGSVAAGQWPVKIDNFAESSPVLVDLDGDGFQEVLVACISGKLYVWRHDGTNFRPGSWPLDLGGDLHLSPAVGILQRGSGPKIVIGSQPHHGLPTLHVLYPDGTSASGWPLQVADLGIFTPSIADIDRDRDGEIVIGSGALQTRAGHVYAFEADGSLVVGSWPAEIYDPADPYSLPGGEPLFVTIADLDPTYPGLEIVTAPVFRDEIYAFHADGTAVSKWPAGGRPGRYVGNSPAIGDVDGQPGLEVLTGEGAADSGGRRFYMLHANGANLAGTPLDLGGFMQTSPAMGDFDGDGKIEVVQAVASTGAIRLIEVDGPGASLESLIWPMQQHDACRTSFLDDVPEVTAVGEPPDCVDIARSPGVASDLQIWSQASAGKIAFHVLVGRLGAGDLEVFDLGGRRVAALSGGRDVGPGETVFTLSGSEALGSGVYFARAMIRSPRRIVTGNAKIVVIR
jgi:hypothetical protein